MSINPNSIGDNGRGHGKDILIIIKAGLHRCTGGVAFHKEADCRMLKICVSDLKSAGWDFTKLSKVKKNTLYVYFITRQGVAQI